MCKYWEGTTHVDVGGNVRFLNEDSEEEIENLILELLNENDKYKAMCDAASERAKMKFSYAKISDESIR